MNILYAEDCDDMAKLVFGTLSSLYPKLYVVRLCNGVDAFHEFRLKELIPKGTSYQMLITDNIMPSMCGVELAKLIRTEYNSTIPIIMHTSSNLNEIDISNLDGIAFKDDIKGLVKLVGNMLNYIGT